MFGYRGGEDAETVARKRGYIVDAQRRWPFMTRYDATTIHNETQLATMVGDRLGLSKLAAKQEVEEWMAGKRF